jgi:penicillin-binding protein 1A
MKSLVFKIVLALIGVGTLAGVSAALVFTYLNLELPKIEKLQDYRPNLATQILSKDGYVLAEMGAERREIVEIKDVPARVIDAFLSAEDDKFFEHKGVDYFGLVRAMFANFKAGKVVQGGSTITQQVAKSLLLSSERSITRKVKDFILAQRIEEKLSKKEILYLYLNQVYLGAGYYGVKAAAHGYYNKELKNITVAEAAMLAGLLVAPGKYSPYVNPAPAKKRQHYVLDRMLKLNKITQAQYDQAMHENTIFHIREEELRAPYFTEWVRQKVVEVVGEKEFLVNGVKVQTTLDWELQKVAEEQVLKGIKDIDKRQGYKGPFAHIEPSEFSKFETETQRNIFKKHSRFFTISEHNEKVYEYILERDPVQNVVQVNTQYEAVVTAVDDSLHTVFISLAGAPGIIPFDYYKWAHKRSISENTAYYKEVTKPSTILRVGDLIHVQMIKPAVSMLPYLGKDGIANFNHLKNANQLRNQKYILCQLDQPAEVQGALFSVDARSGEIISYVGGSDFRLSKFNRVIQAKRQPGSSFKPILFAAALEHGYNAATIIMDTPEAMPGFDSASSWKPKNYDGEYRGPVTMRTALEQSRNIPTIKIADKVGVGTILKFVERIGFNAKLESNLSIALGTFGVSPFDMVATYAMFPNGGQKVNPHAILSVVDRDGKKFTIDEGDNPNLKKEERQVYDPRMAFVMTQLLRGVVQHGTGQSAAELSPNIAGKTGTTNDYVDAWFVGFSPNVVTAVWTGFDDNRTIGWGETGGRSALPIWKEYMRANIKKYGDQPFEVPAGITTEWIQKETGKRLAANIPGAFMEYFAEGATAPTMLPPLAPGEAKAPEVPAVPAPKTRPLGDDEYFENQ